MPLSHFGLHLPFFILLFLLSSLPPHFFFFFFLNDPAPPEIYPLSLPDALPIYDRPRKKYTARSYSRSTLRPPNRYSASVPRTTVTTISIATPLQAGNASTIPAAP